MPNALTRLHANLMSSLEEIGACGGLTPAQTRRRFAWSTYLTAAMIIFIAISH